MAKGEKKEEQERNMRFSADFTVQAACIPTALLPLFRADFPT
jgi:hypothetical protein